MSIEPSKLGQPDSSSQSTPQDDSDEVKIPTISITEELSNFDLGHPSDTSGTETETEMSDRRHDKHHESSKSSSSKSSSKSSRSKTDDWSEVLEPDERRRIQNRIAQRKFREKTKEQKEANERDAKNRQSAGLAYSTPDPGDMGTDYELSGLPWGSLSLKHVVERGNARERDSQRGSQQASYYDYYGGSGSGRGSESQSR